VGTIFFVAILRDADLQSAPQDEADGNVDPSNPREMPQLPMTSRVRVDRLLVERGLFESRAQAQAAIEAGLVVANETPVTKASQELAADAVLRAERPHPYVSRGGVKLAAALDHFGLDPAGQVCLDVGASTGGFSDVLLARGAARIYAVDVGRAQLHCTLRSHGEMVVLEETDIRSLAPDRLVPPPTFVVVDVSFISLKLVLSAALRLAQPPARLVALIKPQFEAGRANVKKQKGVIRDPRIHDAVTEDVMGAVAALGWRVLGLMPSPILGGDGNREFLLGAARD
jgi:23S rRNA (cytidine1920-2'-O)/16S rRNA (cytidine1409-2'-O)-methyltransferase